MAERYFGALIDQKKKAEVLGRIRRHEAPFCAEKPAPEKPLQKANVVSTYAENDLGKEIKILSAGRPANSIIIAAAPVTNRSIRFDYLGAFKLVSTHRLHLPSNVLHDDYLVHSEKWEPLKERNYYSAWAREILAYPEEDGVFVQGKDIVDSKTGWTLPASYIPPNAIGEKGIGLFIDPGMIHEESRNIIINPKTIIVLHGLLQDGTVGKVDERTRIPLQTEVLLLGQLSDEEKRSFYRISGVGVRPLARGGNNDLGGKRYILANLRPSEALGVGGVE